jgi:tRNA dimethylallyltransferase
MQLMLQEHADLERILVALDKDIFDRTDRSSKKRIVRAIEVARRRKIFPPEPDAVAPSRPAVRPLVLCTRWDRPALRGRIDRRLDERLSAGMIDEVRALRTGGLPDERLFMLGMEYKFIARYLREELACAAMVEQLRHAIHQLAKRQDSYFRGMERRGCAVHRIDEARIDAAREAIRSSSMHLSNTDPQ